MFYFYISQKDKFDLKDFSIFYKNVWEYGLQPKEAIKLNEEYILIELEEEYKKNPNMFDLSDIDMLEEIDDVEDFLDELEEKRKGWEY